MDLKTLFLISRTIRLCVYEYDELLFLLLFKWIISRNSRAYRKQDLISVPELFCNGPKNHKDSTEPSRDSPIGIISYYIFSQSHSILEGTARSWENLGYTLFASFCNR